MHRTKKKKNNNSIMDPKISLQTMKLLVKIIWGFYSVFTLILLGYLANDLTFLPFCKNTVLNLVALSSICLLYNLLNIFIHFQRDPRITEHIPWTEHSKLDGVWHLYDYILEFRLIVIFW